MDFSTTNQNLPASNVVSMNDEEIISPEDWVGLARSQSNKFLRQHTLKLYAKANGFDTPDKLVEELNTRSSEHSLDLSTGN